MTGERLWDEYLRFCETRKRVSTSGECGLTNLDDLSPTMLLPLIGFLSKAKVRFAPSSDVRLADCLHRITSQSPVSLRDGISCPALVLPQNQRDVGPVLARLVDRHGGGKQFGGRNILMYLVGELAHNVYDHSCSNHAYIMGQERQDTGCLEVAIFDDGITVAGSLEQSGVILDDDVLAIAMAMNGLSSKREGRRGYGLRSNIRMCIEGLRGDVLMVSGEAAVELRGIHDKPDSRQEAYRIESNVYHLEGTLVSVRIPLQEEEVDLYEFA